MKITPLEIRQKSFEKAFRGINKEEVTAFLLSLSHEWERMLDENKAHKNQIDKLDKEVQKLREVENTLFKTLKTAEDTGANVVDQANKMAELHLKETQINAEAMINDAKNKARSIIDRSEDQAKEVIQEMSGEVKELEENYRIIESQKEHVMSQLKILSSELMSKVEKVKHQESGIESHLKKVKQMLRDTSERVENRAEAFDYDNVSSKKPEILKTEILKTEKPKPAVVKVETPIEPLSSDSKRTNLDVSESDKKQVKKNYIPDSNPISRKSKPKETERKVKSSADFSFFDQLED